MFPVAIVIVALCYIMITGGCDARKSQVIKEEDEPAYVRAQSEKKRGNFKEALSAFSKVVEKRSDAPESHMEIGLIYLNNLNDPIAAIYHFRKYLELKPDTKQSQFVRQCIETSQKKFAAGLPCNPFGVDDYNLKLEESLRKLNAENIELKEKLNELMIQLEKSQGTQSSGRNVATTSATKPQETEVAPAHNTTPTRQTASASQTSSRTQSSANTQVIASGKFYTVQPGDTLSSISRKFYKTDNRWKDIYNANRDRMSSPTNLKPGQQLRIP